MTNEKQVGDGAANTLDAPIEEKRLSTVDPEDDELANVFSAFGKISASDELKAATIATILGQGRTTRSDVENNHVAHPTDQHTGEPAGGEHAPAATADRTAAPETEGPAKPAPSKTGGRHKKGTWTRVRSIRLIAIAACLAFALVGGAAWATPTAHMRIGNGDSAIDVDVNCFGIAVSASSDDEDVAKLVSEANLNNGPANEAIDKACAIFAEIDADKPIEISIQSQNPDQQNDLEAKADEASRNHVHAQATGREANTADEGAQPAGAPTDSASGEPSSSGNGSTAPQRENPDRHDAPAGTSEQAAEPQEPARTEQPDGSNPSGKSPSATSAPSAPSANPSAPERLSPQNDRPNETSGSPNGSGNPSGEAPPSNADPSRNR